MPLGGAGLQAGGGLVADDRLEHRVRLGLLRVGQVGGDRRVLEPWSDPLVRVVGVGPRLTHRRRRAGGRDLGAVGPGASERGPQVLAPALASDGQTVVALLGSGRRMCRSGSPSIGPHFSVPGRSGRALRLPIGKPISAATRSISSNSSGTPGTSRNAPAVPSLSTAYTSAKISATSSWWPGSS